MPTSLLNVAAKSAAGHDNVARQAIDRIPTLETNVGETERLASLAIGGAIAGCSLMARRPSILGALAGGALIFRGLTGNCMGYRALGVNTASGEGAQGVMGAGEGAKVEHAVTVDRPVGEVYRFWRRFENLPQFMTHLLEVKEIDAKRSRWVARGPLGIRVEWQADIVTDTPNETISWKSVEGADVDTAGSVHFQATNMGRSTEIRVSLKYNPPGGRLGAAAAKLFGKDPEQQIREDLQKLKEILNTGASTHPRPNGSRVS